MFLYMNTNNKVFIYEHEPKKKFSIIPSSKPLLNKTDDNIVDKVNKH